MGVLGPGMAFGELCMFAEEAHQLSDRQRFYQAIALTESYYITLSMREFGAVMRSHEEAIEKARLAFLRTIPEFTHMGNNILKKLCYEFKPVNCIKNHVLYREGDDSNYIYFVLSGGFVIQKLVKTVREEFIVEEPGQLIDGVKKAED
jgi:CRP-like cAMP-binding protein